MENVEQEERRGGDWGEQAVEPISRHPVRMASGGSSMVHSPVKRLRMVVLFGIIGCPPV
jgi:hypothetical protein